MHQLNLVKRGKLATCLFYQQSSLAITILNLFGNTQLLTIIMAF